MESIQPLITWLHTHPQYAMSITFLVAFAESLAVVGSIIPGSVTMTAIGILAGSGILRIDYTIVYATLGAIAGDSASYFLGYFFSERLTKMWPFHRYPHWLRFGEDFFRKHGKKSVLIGRFAGPLRAIIPVVAGMLHMRQWHFLVANIISGFLWSILYVVPGILIGSAASELSTETAIRFCVTLLVLLAGFWLLGIVAKWLIVRLSLYINRQLHGFWVAGLQGSAFRKLLRTITPEHESNHAGTAAWIVFFLLISLLLLWTSYYVVQHPAAGINIAIHYGLASFKTQGFDRFFVSIYQLGNSIVLGSLFAVVSLLTIISRRWYLLFYWFSVLIWSHILVSGIHIITHMHYPSENLAFIMTFLMSIYLFVQRKIPLVARVYIRWSFIGIVSLYALAVLYLHEAAFFDVVGAYLVGCCVTSIHWIFFRTRAAEATLSYRYVMLLLIITVSISFMTSWALYYKQDIQTYKLHFSHHLLTFQQWWYQNQSLLPRFQKTRLGHVASPFNIQYAGDLPMFIQSLEHSGWQRQDENFYHNLVKKLTNHPMQHITPILSPLYLNQKPVLIMRYYHLQSKKIYIMRLWRSNYLVLGQSEPIWLGYMHAYPMLKHDVDSRHLYITLPSFFIRSLNKSAYAYKIVLMSHTPVVLLTQSENITEE